MANRIPLELAAVPGSPQALSEQAGDVSEVAGDVLEQPKDVSA